MSNDQPAQAVIRGEHVGLRPVVQSDLAVLEAWTNDSEIHSSYNTFGLKRTNGIEQGFQTEGLLADDQATLMILTLAGEIVGSMSYHQVGYGPHSRAYNMGLSIVPEQRGKGGGDEKNWDFEMRAHGVMGAPDAEIKDRYVAYHAEGFAV